MPYLIVCGGCKKKLRIPDTMVGKTIKCPQYAKKMIFKPRAKPADPVLSAASPEAPPKKAAAKPMVPQAKTSPRPTVAPAPPIKKKPVPAPPPEPASDPEPDPDIDFDSIPDSETPARRAFEPAPEPEPAPPPPPKFQPKPSPPPRPAAKKADDDDDEASKTKPIFIVLGSVILVGGLIWYLFFTGPTGGLVSGKATLDNAPLKGASVAFIGQGDKNKGTLIAATNDEGAYKLLGNEGAGIPAGKYKVVVTKMALKGGQVPSGEGRDEAEEKGLLVNILPPIYENTASTPFEFEVKVGQNTFNLDLKK